MASKLTWPNQLASVPMSCATMAPAEAYPADINTITVRAAIRLIFTLPFIEKLQVPLAAGRTTHAVEQHTSDYTYPGGKGNRLPRQETPDTVKSAERRYPNNALTVCPMAVNRCQITTSGQLARLWQARYGQSRQSGRHPLGANPRRVNEQGTWRSASNRPPAYLPMQKRLKI